MKRILLAILCWLSITVSAQAKQFPNPVGFVNDFADVLTVEQRMSLEQTLSAFEQRTTMEITVVTLRQIGEQSAGEAAKQVGNEWGVGKEINNGIVFLIAPKEHKIAIAAGSGVRDKMPESRLDSIRDDHVLPKMREGNFAQGIMNGTQAIMENLEFEASQDQTADDNSYHVLLILLMIFVPILSSIFVYTRRNKRSRVMTNILKLEGAITSLEKDAIRTGTYQHVASKIDELRERMDDVVAHCVKATYASWYPAECALSWLSLEIYYVIPTEIRKIVDARTKGPVFLADLQNKIPANSPLQPKLKKAVEEASRSGMINWITLYPVLLRLIPSRDGTHQSAHSSNTGDGTSCGFGGGNFNSATVSEGNY